MKIVTILLYLLAMFPQLDSCDSRECHGDLFEGVLNVTIIKSDCCNHDHGSHQHHCSVDNHHHGDESCSFRSFSLIRAPRESIRRAPLVAKPVLQFVLLSRGALRAPPLPVFEEKNTHTTIQLQQVKTTIIRC